MRSARKYISIQNTSKALILSKIYQKALILSQIHQKLKVHYEEMSELLGIMKRGRGPLKALEGLCAMMAPSEWGSGYEPLLRMGVGIGGRMGGWVDMNLF